jgi:hypothetical protein
MKTITSSQFIRLIIAVFFGAVLISLIGELIGINRSIINFIIYILSSASLFYLLYVRLDGMYWNRNLALLGLFPPLAIAFSIYIYFVSPNSEDYDL